MGRGYGGGDPPADGSESGGGCQLSCRQHAEILGSGFGMIKQVRSGGAALCTAAVVVQAR